MSQVTERAVLAGGCFWGVQDLIRNRRGVISTRVGYTGGDVANATYRNHGSHAEAIEIIFDPEFSGGTGLDGTTGFAGFPTGEATRTGKPEPTPYVARAFYRHTFEFEGESEKVEDAANEIAGVRQRNRLQISIGKMSAEDVLDDIGRLPEWGVTSIKLFMAYKGALQVDDTTLFRCMERAAEAGVLTMVHAENGDAIDILVRKALARGDTAPKFHALTRPPQLEGEATGRAIALAEVAGAPLAHPGSDDEPQASETAGNQIAGIGPEHHVARFGDRRAYEPGGEPLTAPIRNLIFGIRKECLID